MFDAFKKASFNSIKVQLEHKRQKEQLIKKQKFQFHKGSIRTSTERKNQTAQTRFNSIKVQLELFYSL